MAIPNEYRVYVTDLLRAAVPSVVGISFGDNEQDTSQWIVHYENPGPNDAATVAAWVAAFNPNVTPVPSQVTMFQARAALINAGIFAQADAAIKNSNNQVDIAAWGYSTVVSRDSPFLNNMAAALGLTGQQVDDLFRAAIQIAV